MNATITITLAALLATSLLANAVQAAAYISYRRIINGIIDGLETDAIARNRQSLSEWKRRSLAAEKGMYAKCSTHNERVKK